MNVELPPDAIKFIETLVATGEFTSASDAVVEGVRLLMSREELKADIRQGLRELDEGLGTNGTEVFAELRERAKGPRKNNFYKIR